ncbi:hypothetical protein GLOIN_2v82649 [Rhizophagus clarus]|uniref:Uncharacterized protein n=1 Tax=Rhizophagus clarus TaxID=94130 RepID=A0A8H3LFY2_9GLOM|nr:hypothetical protein GLOIN_2v82649 [Rhizophagus clarus]
MLIDISEHITNQAPFLETSDSFVAPDDLHPVLKQLDIKYWNYHNFVLQIIKSEYVVDNLENVEIMWLSALKNLVSRKDIGREHHDFIQKLIEFQKFVLLDQKIMSALKEYVDQCMRYRLAKSAANMEKCIEEQSRKYYISKEVNRQLFSEFSSSLKRSLSKGEIETNDEHKPQKRLRNDENEQENFDEDQRYDKEKIVPKRNVSKYIQNDLAEEIFASLQLVPLAGCKWIWKGTNICQSFRENSKEIETPLQIGVVNFNKISCTKYLSSSLICHMQEQLDDDNVEKVFIDDTEERWFNKFMVEVEDEVQQYLDKFQNCTTLDELRQALLENPVYDGTNNNFNINYVHQFINHMYILYTNDILNRAMTENEYFTYVWVPLISFAFLEKDGMFITSDKILSNAFERLKKLAKMQGPKFDSEVTTMSSGVEVIIFQENMKNGTQASDLSKLEYCTKILLSGIFLNLPTVSRSEIYNFEVYAIQTNGLNLTLSAASYMFENTICIFGLSDIIIPQTINEFPRCLKAIYKVLSWKSRLQRNAKNFHELLGKTKTKS